MQNPKSKSVDETTDKESNRSEKPSKSTPKRSQSVSDSLLKGTDSSLHVSPDKKKVNCNICKEKLETYFPHFPHIIAHVQFLINVLSQ